MKSNITIHLEKNYTPPPPPGILDGFLSLELEKSIKFIVYKAF